MLTAIFCFNRLKLKRPQTAKMYRALLDEMYATALAEEEAAAAKGQAAKARL